MLRWGEGADAAEMTSLDDVRLDDTGSVPDAADVPSHGAEPRSSTGSDVGRGDEGGLPELGAVIGNYRLLEVIGTGGMGRVYKAEHTLLGKKVALKMLRRRYAQSPDAVQRFFSEARAVTSIEHDNLVDVTDFVETSEWPPCFVMQLLRGQSLARAIREEGPFPIPRLLGVAAQAASAVAAVHGASIIHRDLKPANIFLAQHRGGGEVVKLLDFGVAKLLDEQGISMHDTNAGVPIGTPDYMAPEQVTGSARIDYRVDIWSLGAVLYEAATGRLPFKASSFGELVLALLSKEAAPPNQLRGDREPLPKALELLIMQCLSRVAAQRPSSMREIHERLLALSAPFAIPFLDGRPLTLAETDPGVAPSDVLVGGPRFVPPADALRRPLDDDDDLPSGGAPTGEIPGALPRRRPLRRVAAAAITLAVIVGAGALAFPSGEPERTEAAEVAPAAAHERVTLSFTSTPPGASVFLDGNAEALGRTPFDLEVPRAQEPLRFEVRIDGHVPASAQVTPDESQRIQSALAPIAAPPVQQEPARKERPRRERAQQGEKGGSGRDKTGLIEVF